MNEQAQLEKDYNIKKESLYNMIIKIDSMEQLKNEGWKIINNIDNESKVNNADYKEKKLSIISVLGNKNSGKSFILHLLTEKIVPNGYTVTTEGLSFIIPDEKVNKGDNYILIDTAGTESPLLVEEKKNLSLETKDKIAKDRQITDYFLQKFILEKSDIFLCIVDNLTLTNQKFINRIIKNYGNKNKTIFIIHNLKTFIDKNQVENYIKNILKESVTFDLQDEEYFNIEDDIKEGNKKYFKQLLNDKYKNDYDKNKEIIHLILANENSDAGKYYNRTTINFLKKQLKQIKEKKAFDIIKNIKEFLITFSGEIFNKKLEEDSIKEENNCIKLVNIEDLNLKDCLIDELGNNIIKETETIYKPKYRYGYFNPSTEETKFLIEIELFGIWGFSHRIDIKENDFIIKIQGKKQKEIEQINYISSNYIPQNNFQLEIKVENIQGIVNDDPEIKEDNGLYTFIFSLKKIYIEDDVISVEGDEDEDV